MTEEQLAELGYLGYLISHTEDGRVLIEGSSNGIDWLIEDDFGIWWVYEYTSSDTFISVDAFGVFEQAHECARNLR